MAKVRDNTVKINAFWKSKRNAAEMEEVYSQLLRSGRSNVKRHHELTGRLADMEARDDPQVAHMRALLQLPPTEEEVAAGKALTAGLAKPAAPAAATPATAGAAKASPPAAQPAAAPR
jgi:uncharacterized protein YcaQ